MYLASKLKHRIQILKPTQTPNLSGTMDREYITLATIWAGKKEKDQLFFNLQNHEYVNTNIGEEITIEFTVRYSALIGNNIAKAFSNGFSSGFASILRINPISTNNFIFLQDGSTTKGRLFKIYATKRDDNNKEFLQIRCIEIEEQGTGYND